MRRQPYTVLLLDEVEKAHRDVMNLFYQIFDKGTLADGEGRVIDFKNTIVILTSDNGTGGAFTAREYGAAMLGTLMLTFFARHAREKASRRAILLDLLVYDAIGVVITVAAVLAGTLNALGWGIVAVYLFFTAGSAWVLRCEKESQPAAA